MEEKLKFYLDKTIDWGIEFVPKLILAFLIFWIGFKVVNRITKTVDKAILATGISQEIGEFLGNIIEMVMKAAIVLVAISFLGVELSSLVAILGAAAFAIGLSLQGFLGNFASGLTIVFFKPYGIGDWVQIAGTFGKVKSIQIFSTILKTPGQKTVIIPNGKVTDDVITNLSTEGIMRLELNVTMPYEEDFNKVKTIILDALRSVDTIIQDPEPIVGIEAYESHNLLLSIRPYINPDDYWDATYEVHSKIKEAFSKNGIKVAYSEGVELGSIGK
jgi:small conductance mechanosensitive channel